MLSMLLRRLSLGFITVALVSIIIFTGVEFFLTTGDFLDFGVVDLATIFDFV